MQPYYCNWHNLSLVISLHWHIPTIRCHWYCHNTALVGVGMLQFSTTSIMKLDVIFWRWGMEKSYNSDIDLLVNFFLFFFFFTKWFITFSVYLTSCWTNYKTLVGEKGTRRYFHCSVLLIQQKSIDILCSYRTQKILHNIKYTIHHIM